LYAKGRILPEGDLLKRAGKTASDHTKNALKRQKTANIRRRRKIYAYI
jgi:hypothetical protein